MIDERPTMLTWGALFAALAASAGSMWLSLGMNLEACALCFYQRSFAFAVAMIYLVGLLARVRPASSLASLALAPAAAAVWVAVRHVTLEAAGKLECPKGIGGFGSAPQQALFALSVVFAFVAIDSIQSVVRRRHWSLAPLVPAVIGAVFGYLSTIGNPAPKQPTAPYPSAIPIVCRPPYKST
jgi:disulfide bond formation protein DsbB